MIEKIDYINKDLLRASHLARLAGRAKSTATPTLPPMGGKVSEPTFIDGQPGILTKTVAPPKSAGTAAAHAAKAVGTSTRTVERSHRIAKNAPELVTDIRAGTLSLLAAEKQAKATAPPPKPRSEASKQGAVLKETLRYYERKVENLEVYSKDTDFKGVVLLTSQLRTDYIERLHIVCQNISKLISELENTNKKETQ
jgi:hypothetical protein